MWYRCYLKAKVVNFDLQIILDNFSINYIQFVESRVAVTGTQQKLETG